MLKNITAVLNDDAGQGLAEYGLILALIAVVCVAAVATLGTQIRTVLTAIGNQI